MHGLLQLLIFQVVSLVGDVKTTTSITTVMFYTSLLACCIDESSLDNFFFKWSTLAILKYGWTWLIKF